MSASLASPEPSLPRKVGRYTLFDKIGRGGMADIFLAHAETNLGVNRLVVVKQILPHLAESKEFSDLLITEAKLAARLDHANVVQVHDLGRADAFLYIAMQYVEGFDLTELLRRCTRTKTALPVQYALLIVIEALRGLDYAHRRTTEEGAPLGIVHRDVSPSNILISLEGEIKLCDFGIAHANDAMHTSPFSEEVIKGKAGYMSPEQARGDHLDARADVFAIGIVLWELLSGRRLYKTGEGNPPLLEQARAANIGELPSRGLPLEADLYAISKKALATNRDERYPSAQALLLDLEKYVADSKLIASPIKFGEWLIERFGDELVQQRRERERAASAILASGAGVEKNAVPAPIESRATESHSAARDSTRSVPPESTVPSSVAVSPVAVPIGEPSPGPLRGGIWLGVAGLVIIGLIIYFLATH
ncbi:MAG TPA: serine/threonine-protein kinase [Polyangiaceae bacterium]|nr:serine/threonine-protein kinase [Polyangiaceae bacterium]